MDDARIKKIFEAYFEKYKRTEGGASSWSAVWSTRSGKGTFEILMNKCPEGTRFKVFVNGRRVEVYEGWDTFLKAIPGLERDYPDLFDEDAFFSEMEEMV